MFTKDCSQHHFKSNLFHIIHQTQTTLQATTNANTKSLLQAHLVSLHLHKIQFLKQNQDVSEIKTETGQVKKNINERLEYLLLDTTMRDVNNKLIVPAITFTKTPMLDNIDLIKIAAAELLLKEKWKKLDEKLEKKFGPIEKQDKAVKQFSHFSQLGPISINEMSLGNMEMAKKEEKVRLKQQRKQAALDAKNQAEKPTTIEFKLPAVIAESVNEEKQEEPKKTNKPRLKFIPKRKLDFDEDKDEYMPT
ncbi:hypothetical protein AgCh_021491 [Apium graveolens]